MGLISYILGSDSRRNLKKITAISEKIDALAPKYEAMTDAELQAMTPALKERLQNGETVDDILFDAFAAVREAAWRVLGLRPYLVQLMGGVCLHQGRVAEMKTGEGKTLVATLPAYLNALTGKGVHIVTVNDYLARRDAEWMGKVHRFMGLTVGVVVHGMTDDEKRKAYNCDITYGTNNEFGFDYLRDNLKVNLKDMMQRELNFAIVDEVDSILIDEARTPLIISGAGGVSSELYSRVDKFVRTLHGGFEDEVEEALKNAPPKYVKQYHADENVRRALKHFGNWDFEVDRENKTITVFEIDTGDLTEVELERAEDARIAAIVKEIDGWDYNISAKGETVEITDKEPKKPEKGAGDDNDALESLKKMIKASRDWDYSIDRKDKSVTITEKGAKKAEAYFGLAKFGDVENATLSHHIQQALKAHHIFKRDNDYIVQDGEIIIVDEFTGRLMIGRRYSEGLHQAIEAKENVVIRNENKTHATITFQNYFRLYKKLSGMTGTAKTEEEEFRTIYGLDVLEIPTNRPVIRKDLPDAIYPTEERKLAAVVEDIVKCHEKGQPILVGTVTVEKSEELSKMLLKRKIKHNILNAKNHRREAEIIAQAGKKGAVTIATNMAGRGTDILLGGNPEYLAKQDLRDMGKSDEIIELATSFVQNVSPEVEEVRALYKNILAEHKAVTDKEKEEVVSLGGLHIIGTERHESRRIDNQLRGRSGRQGDPGSSLFFVSLQDDLVMRFGGERLQRIYQMFNIDDSAPLQAKSLSRSIENAQRTIEGRNFGIRKRVIEYDDVMNTQRHVIYEERMKVLRGENIHEEILRLIPEYVTEVIRDSIDPGKSAKQWDLDKLNENLYAECLMKEADFITEEKVNNWDYDYLEQQIIDEVIREYEDKIAAYARIAEENHLTVTDFYEVERGVLLRNVDSKWIEHIDAMDQLRRGISLRSYAQENPINAYKKEGMDMFEDMIYSIRHDTLHLLLKIDVVGQLEAVARAAQRRQSAQNYVANGGSGPRRPVKKETTVGRNDPCPCGSGKKYKNCCGKNA